MLRKNGQFASVKDVCKTSEDNWDSGNNTPQPEPVLHRCQHCGVSESSTPAMCRGPAGPRTLCNACGLMRANKGTLRDLTKAGRHIFDQNESFSGERSPGQTNLELVEFGNPSVITEKVCLRGSFTEFLVVVGLGSCPFTYTSHCRDMVLLPNIWTLCILMAVLTWF